MSFEVLEYKDGIVIKNVRDFEPVHIFDCGQCFRWNKDDDGSYTGAAYGRAVRVIKNNDDVYIKGGKLKDSEFWLHYFDMGMDYSSIKEELSADPILKEAVDYGSGIRILNQEAFEIVVSFIISANNRIPMIKRTVENISREYGDKIDFEGKKVYSFPTPAQLSEASVEDLKRCGCGFRAPYIVDTVNRIKNGEVNLDKIKEMDTDSAHKHLMNLKGIGPKVADCILLFSMEKSDAFPVDVWVKRVMQYFYLAPDVSLKKIRNFGREKFGKNAGIAQEYLFYYAREFKGKEGLE